MAREDRYIWDRIYYGMNQTNQHPLCPYPPYFGHDAWRSIIISPRLFPIYPASFVCVLSIYLRLTFTYTL